MVGCLQGIDNREFFSSINKQKVVGSLFLQAQTPQGQNE
jgi:hypothetical protein